MATPSLAMIPSAYADSKLYSVLPNNGDGDFTFNRDSSATRVGSNGLIQTVGFFGNELILSTMVNSVSFPYNTFNEASISGFHAKNTTGTSQRAGTVDELIFVTGKIYRVNVDVSVVSGNAPFLRVRQAVGTNPTLTSIQLVNGNNIITFTSTDTLTGILEFSNSAAAEYRVSNVSVKEVTGDQPRLNYDISNGVVQSCPSLLLEPASTNVINYSEDFSNSAWTKNNTTVASGFTSPDGTNNAYLMTDDATDSKHGVYRLDVLSQDGNIYTRSVFVKKGTARYVVLSTRHLPTSSGTSWIYDFNINNWVLTGSTGAGQSIEDYGNGWHRLSISHISNSNFNNDFSIGISSGATIADTSYSGVGDTVHIWGAQVEQQSYATSYIPNFGQSAGVTRVAETCFGAGTSSTFNSTEGVLYFESSALALVGGDSRISLSDSTLNNRISFAYSPTASKGYIIVKINGVSVINNLNVEIGNHLDTKKIAISYKSGDTKVFLNGVELSIASSVSFSGGALNDLSFESANGSVKFYGNCKDIRVYNEALTDSQLQTLTTI